MKICRKYFPVFTSIFVFIIYLFTIAPSVVEIDAGELSTVQATLGIAHPTGYPLFTLAGFLFSQLPLPFSTIFSLNLLAAIWCSLAVGIFVYTAKLILDNLAPVVIPASKEMKRGKKKQAESKSQAPAMSQTEKIIAAISGGLILAFSKTFWFQSTSVEVYSMQVFLFCLVILFLLKGYYLFEPGKNNFGKSHWMVFAAVLALCFSNHMTSILILPGAAYIYFTKFGFNKKSIRQIFVMLFLFIPILAAFYSYLPVRAAQNPALNWGNPVDIENFFRHVSGSQYRVWLFSSVDAAKKQLGYFINELPHEFTAMLFFIIVGIFSSFRKSRKMFAFLLITFLTAVLYSINYDINDIDSYFLLAYISLSFFAAFGVLSTLKFFLKRKAASAISASFIIILLAGHFYLTFGEVSQHNNYAYEDYTKALVGSVDRNSVILSYQWDYFVAPAYYFQLVENFRKDVKIVDKELLRRSWYYHQQETDHPDVFARMKPAVNNFLEAVSPFERGEKFDPARLETDYREVMTDLVSTNIERYSVYIGPELFNNEMQKGQFVLPEGYTLVPGLFLFKVVKGKKYVPAPPPDFELRLPAERDRYILMIENFIGNMLTRRALYEMQFDKVDKAREYIEKIKTTLPDYTVPRGLDEALGNKKD